MAKLRFKVVDGVPTRKLGRIQRQSKIPWKDRPSPTQTHRYRVRATEGNELVQDNVNCLWEPDQRTPGDKVTLTFESGGQEYVSGRWTKLGNDWEQVYP